MNFFNKNNTVFFWNSWDTFYKKHFLFVFYPFLLLVIITAVFIPLQDSFSIDWLTETDTKTIPIAIDTIPIGFVSLEVPAEIALVQQYFSGDFMKIHIVYGYIYVFLLFFLYSILFSVGTVLPRFWYIFFVGISIFLLATLQIHQIKFFGFSNQYPFIVLIVCICSLSYYFYTKSPFIPFFIRVSSFYGIFLMLIFLSIFFGETNYPLFTLCQNTYISALLITVLFCLLVGHEIIYWILYVSTKGGRSYIPSNNTKHFLSLSLLYMLMLLLIYTYNTRIIKVEIISVSPIMILIFSAILGLWGLKDREERYGAISPFYPFVAILYLTLGMITFSTIIWQMVQNNDPVLETIDDSIVFGHIGFGFIFILYVIANYLTPLMQNQQVYKIVFKESNMPYMSYRLGGIVIICAFFFYTEKISYSQAIAGYCNQIGDLLVLKKNIPAAIHSYKQGNFMGYANQKSNYQLAYLLHSQKEKEALYYAELSTQKNPSPQAFINTANQYNQKGRFLEGIFILQEACKNYPNDPFLQNNMGYLYLKTDIADSSLQYLKQSLQNESTYSQSLTNIAYLAFQLGTIPSPQELNQYDSSLLYENFSINYFASLIKAKKTDEDIHINTIFTNKTLTKNSLHLIINASLASIKNPKNILPPLKNYINDTSNKQYKEPLELIYSLHAYYHNNVAEAYTLLDKLQENNHNTRAEYLYIMGIFALQQNNPEKAIAFLEKSVEEPYYPAFKALITAYLENNNPEKAITLLQTIDLTEDQELKAYSEYIYSALHSPINDEQKYQYIRWNWKKLPEETIQSILYTIQNETIQAKANLFLTHIYIQKEKIPEAEQLLESITEEMIPPEMRLEKQKIQYQVHLQKNGLSECSYPILPNDKATLKEIKAYREAKDWKNLIHKVSENPFDLTLLIAATDFCMQQKEWEHAYNILLIAYSFHPHECKVIQRYAIASLMRGLNMYAENSLLKCSKCMKKEQYLSFEKKYTHLKDSLLNSQWE
ncbi:MAG: tetratricopeptide repeat protein [Chitinophagaceae bacterium]|nr:tetratricopeptide repeat protein [Chitinophagaceae bacterium]